MSILFFVFLLCSQEGFSYRKQINTNIFKKKNKSLFILFYFWVRRKSLKNIWQTTLVQTTITTKMNGLIHYISIATTYTAKQQQHTPNTRNKIVFLAASNLARQCTISCFPRPEILYYSRKRISPQRQARTNDLSKMFFCTNLYLSEYQ